MDLDEFAAAELAVRGIKLEGLRIAVRAPWDASCIASLVDSNRLGNRACGTIFTILKYRVHTL